MEGSAPPSADLVAALLSEEGIPFDREASVSGVRPDFVIETPRGVVVVDVKDYELDTEGQARAYELARYYENVVGAHRAFVVLPLLKRGRLREGIVSPAQLLGFLRREFERPVSRSLDAASVPGDDFLLPSLRTRRGGIVSRGQPFVFAAMPFARTYNDVYFVAIAGACDRIGLTSTRVDHDVYTGDIVQHIKDSIRDSVAVVADLSESKPNVLYEVGFAHALGKPTIHICSTP
jgi:hypothetical protein